MTPLGSVHVDIKDFNLPGDGLGSLESIAGQVTGLSTFQGMTEQLGKAVGASWLPEMYKSGALAPIQAIDWGTATGITAAIAGQFPGDALAGLAELARPAVPPFLPPAIIETEDEYVRDLEERLEALEAVEAERDALAARCAVLERKVKELRVLRRCEVLDASQEHTPEPPVNDSQFPDPK